MNIEVIACAYNEEKLMPLFLQHYDFADRINVLLDVDSTDRTGEICRANPKCNIIPLRFPDGLNDSMKADFINDVAASIQSGWIIAVDVDEFIFPREQFNGLEEIAYFVKFLQMYRHESEKDLNDLEPAMLQRRHGDKEGQGGKPCIVRAGMGFKWAAGCHHITRGPKVEPCEGVFFCAHWQMADIPLAIERRIKNSRERMSQHNLKHRLCFHNFDITEEAIITECKAHLHDERLF